MQQSPARPRFLSTLGGFASGRMLKLFSSSVMDQVVLSAANFSVGFLLIRFTSDDDYGLYVLLLTALQLMVTLQKASISGPLALVVAPKTPVERVRSVGAIKDAQRRLLLKLVVGLQAVPLAAVLTGWLTPRQALFLSLGIVCLWTSLRRELLRDLLLLFARADRLLLADLVFACLLAGGAALAVLSHGAAVLWVAGTMVAAAVAGEALAFRMLADKPGWLSGDAGPVLRQVRPLGFWAMLGALTYWLYSGATNYMLAGALDLKAVADVNATRLLLMPVIMLSLGVQGVVNPMAALWYAEVGLPRLIRRLAGFTLGLLVIDLVYLALVWIFRDWLTHSFLHKQIGQRDELLLLWTAWALIGVLRMGLGYALFAAGKLKVLAAQGIVSAMVAIAITGFGVRYWGAATALIGQLAGETINLIGIGLMLREAFRPVATVQSAASQPEKAAS